MSSVDWSRQRDGAEFDAIAAMRARLKAQAQSVEQANASRSGWSLPAWPAFPSWPKAQKAPPPHAPVVAAAVAPAEPAAPVRAATFRDLLEMRGLRRLGAVVGGLATLWVAFYLVAPPQPDLTDIEEPHRFWTDVAKPFRFYEVAWPDLGEITRYEAKHTRFGGGRRDTLTFGSLAEDTPHLRITFYRVGVEEAPPATFATEIARRAAEVEMTVEASGRGEVMPTRFGAFEVADFRLTGEAGMHACLGFRLNQDEPAFRISGYACGDSARAMDRGSLSCMLDRIDLVGAGMDEQLSAFFAQAEGKRRVDCFPLRNARAAKWFEPHGDAPYLRFTTLKR